MKKKTITKILYIVYLLALITFIFSNSFASMEESAENSGRVLSFINNILEFMHFPFLLSELFVRKAAHFTEFFVLGASFFGYAVLFCKVSINKVVYCAFSSCLVAMADETIQYFTGRGSMLLDVWLDLSGAVTAILLFYIIYRSKCKCIKF